MSKDFSEEDKVEFLRRLVKTRETVDRFTDSLVHCDRSTEEGEAEFQELLQKLASPEEIYCQHGRYYLSDCRSCELLEIQLIKENRHPAITYEEWLKLPNREEEWGEDDDL